LILENIITQEGGLLVLGSTNPIHEFEYTLIDSVFVNVRNLGDSGGAISFKNQFKGKVSI